MSLNDVETAPLDALRLHKASSLYPVDLGLAVPAEQDARVALVKSDPPPV